MTEEQHESTFPTMNQYAFRGRFYPLPTSPAINEERFDEGVEDATNQGVGYLIITNISKKANIKALIATAAAHRFIPVLVGEPNITEHDCCLVKPGNNKSTTTANKSVINRTAINTTTANNTTTATSIAQSTTTTTPDEIILETNSAVEGDDIPANEHDNIPSSEPIITDCEYISVLRCDTMHQLVQYLTKRGVPLVGIEIMDNARSILADNAFPTTSPATSPTAFPAVSTSISNSDGITAANDGNLAPESKWTEQLNPSSQSNPSQSNRPHHHRSMIAFMPGNEGTGLSTGHKAMCNGQFVYIPHYGAGE